MASNFFKDDNGKVAGGVLRPVFNATTGVKSANTGVAIAELSIATLVATANANSQGEVILRVAVIGSNACFFSLGAASAAPSDNTPMIRLPGNSVEYFKAQSTDASAYHQQITGASALEISVMK